MAEPSPARLAVQGFTELAAWYTRLVGDLAAGVAEAAADGKLDADAATAAWTRSMALPFLGFTALVNEVVDAATLQTVGVRGHRQVESEVFEAGADGEIVLAPKPLTSAFRDELANVEVVRMEGRKFKLVARAVPAEVVGVFQGTVLIGDPGDLDDPRHEQHVWLVVS